MFWRSCQSAFQTGRFLLLPCPPQFGESSTWFFWSIQLILSLVPFTRIFESWWISSVVSGTPLASCQFPGAQSPHVAFVFTLTYLPLISPLFRNRLLSYSQNDPLALTKCLLSSLINFPNAWIRRCPLSQHRRIQNEVIIWSYARPLLLPDCGVPVTPKGNPGSLCLIPWRDVTSMFRCQPPFCHSRNSHFSCIDLEGDGIDNLSRGLAMSRCFILLQLREASGIVKL